MGIFSRRQSAVIDPTAAVGTGTSETADAPRSVPLDPAFQALTGLWTIDRSHSRVGFSVRHAMVTTVRGAFTDYDSTSYFDGARPSESRAELVVRVASVDTGVEQSEPASTAPPPSTAPNGVWPTTSASRRAAPW